MQVKKTTSWWSSLATRAEKLLFDDGKREELQVSQWQVQACVQGISEAFLLPVLALVIDQFAFEVNGFHCDNGSEYVNHKVAKLLEKLRIKQTKSRSRHSNDNALAESKNASVISKHMGYSHIPQKYAKPVNAFYEGVFNSWLNLHRPCLFATEEVSARGKVIRRYKKWGIQLFTVTL